MSPEHPFGVLLLSQSSCQVWVLPGGRRGSVCVWGSAGCLQVGHIRSSDGPAHAPGHLGSWREAGRGVERESLGGHALTPRSSFCRSSRPPPSGFLQHPLPPEDRESRSTWHGVGRREYTGMGLLVSFLRCFCLCSPPPGAPVPLCALCFLRKRRIKKRRDVPRSWWTCFLFAETRVLAVASPKATSAKTSASGGGVPSREPAGAAEDGS